MVIDRQTIWHPQSWSLTDIQHQRLDVLAMDKVSAAMKKTSELFLILAALDAKCIDSSPLRGAKYYKNTPENYPKSLKKLI